MKLIFIDEFKPKMASATTRSYGLSAVVLDSAYYTNFKEGFDLEFRKLGWSKEEELKGRYVYSDNIFKDITQDKRLGFAEGLFKLSSSSSGKSKRITALVALGFFEKDKNETEIYLALLKRILKKLGKPVDKKQDKNVVTILLDGNDEIAKKVKDTDLYTMIINELDKDWIIFEKPIFVKSSNLHPGIIFSDFVSFFHQNYLDTNNFFKKTSETFLQLLEKSDVGLTAEEEKHLNAHLINYRKKKESTRIISILRDIKYV